MTHQANIINDLGTLSKVPNKVLAELVDKAALCIGSAVHDAKLNNNDIALINIGIGTLSVNLSDMQCKFVPGKNLKEAIKRSSVRDIDPLEFLLEEVTAAKLLDICSEVL